MRVQFNYEQKDMVDAALRFLRRSKAVRSWRWKGTILITLFYWLVIYVIFVSFLHNPYLAVIEAVLVAVMVAALYPRWHERATEKRLRRFYKESYGDINIFHCEVELTPQEIRIDGDNTRTVYEWKLVDEIVSTDDSVDIFTRRGGVIVRNRAFESPEERQRFIELARECLRGKINHESI
ncbi:MAG TPA: YcxB family protein [Pyrinomonadaceae bacterium]